MRIPLFKDGDIICFARRRWNTLFHRPQRLMSRFAQEHRVFYIEEPVYDAESNHFEVQQVSNLSLWIVVPHLSATATDHQNKICGELLDDLIKNFDIRKYITWYYTPLALRFSKHLAPLALVYDCMSDVQGSASASSELIVCEHELLHKADIVFAAGYGLYETMRNRHHNIYAFPNSIDKEHFHGARMVTEELPEQAAIPHPRIGFHGIVDECVDVKLLTTLAEQRPDWHFIIIGPIAAANTESLPSKPNMHFLGAKEYDIVPRYIAGWDVGIIPYAHNDHTKYLHPCKTMEYLAMGKPVVSTSIYDVVVPYGKKGLVLIADTVPVFIAAIEKALAMRGIKQRVLKADRFLSNISWDKTHRHMYILIEAVIERKKPLLKLRGWGP